MQVTIQYCMIQIHLGDQFSFLRFWFTWLWHDSRLSWERRRFRIDDASIDARIAWMPDIILLNR